MNDRSVLEQIQHLADEEHRLLEQAGSHGLGADDEAKLKEIEVHLDQCWDLLRQRRGRRHAGQDPDDARVRDASTVERYLQ